MLPGQEVAGRFEIEREVGSGGMATVYRALDRATGEPVAVKVLRRQTMEARSDEVIRFAREARTLAQIRHPGVVRYVAHGQTESGEPYLAMEWLEGEDLRERLSRLGLTIAETVALTLRVAEALSAVHALGFVHRDVKPSNLFLVEGDVLDVKLLDFGVARADYASIVLTRPGTVVGTPGYMAPEQARGQGDIDQRADIFSLGCVLFKCLTGSAPFEGNHVVAVLTKVLLEEAPRVCSLRPTVPAALDGLVARMLSKTRSGRPATVASVIASLQALGPLDQTGTPASREGMPSGLTVGEQRVMAMLLIGPSRAGESALHEGDTAVGGRPPPGYATTLDAALDALVREYGGNADRLVDGTRVVTFTGATVARDLSSRAARCALAVRRLLPSVPIALAMIRAEVMGTRPIGDAIDRAARLLMRPLRPVTTSTSGKMVPIAIDDVTAALLDRRFEVTPVPTGLALVGFGELAAGTRTLLGRPTPCVGREWELTSLESLLGECVDDPVTRAVLLTAPAGMGKSRIVFEFLAIARRRAPDLQIWMGQGDSLRAGSAFGLLGQVLRGVFGIQEGEPIRVRRRKVEARVVRHVASSEVPRIAEFLGEIVGAPFDDGESEPLRAARKDARLMSEQMRRAWEEFLEAECAAHPVLLVLEDLHWGDLPTVRFMDAALRRLEAFPLMVLAVARPEVRELFPQLWVDRHVQEIRLNPLSRRASERLVRQVLTDVSVEMAARIAAQADGNVFYLEELIRAIAEGDARGGDDEASLPETVLAMVQARFEGLDPDARRFLRAASVFGEVFWPSGVAALLGELTNAQSIGPWVHELLEREVLVTRQESRFAGERELVFRHALLREGAYAMLTERDRELGHRLAGEWLERHGESDPMLLAQHFERGKHAARAVSCYLRAAEQALRGDDQEAAIARAERGVDCGAAGEDLGELMRVAAEAHLWRGEIIAAEERGLEAIHLLSPATAAWFRAVSQVVIAAGKLGEFDNVERWGAEVSACTPGEGAQSAQIICLSECATHLIFGGRYVAADPLLAATARMAEERPDLDALATAAMQQVRAIRALVAGDAGACLADFQAALASCVQAGARRNACTIRSNLGFVLAELGDYKGAEDVLRAALNEADRMGIHDLTMAVLQNLGRVLAYRDNIDEGRRLEEQAVEAFERQGNLRLAGSARGYLAQIALLAGDPQPPEREARRAAETLVAAPPLRTMALAVLARALLALGRPEEALAVAHEALEVLESLGEIEEGESMVWLAYAEALAAAGRDAEYTRAILAARARLLARAAKITDLTWRERFLSAVPENARTIALAAQAG